MKIFLLLASIFTSASAFSQQWCPQGATWTYNDYYFFNITYTRYSYDKDTAIANTPCKKISDGYRSAVYTFAQNDTVFFWNSTFEIFVPTYFFNALVGDTVGYRDPSNCPDTIIKQVVDTVGMVEINGQPLRYYVFHVPAKYDIRQSKVIERLGIVGDFMIPSFQYCVSDADYYSLRCYEDDSTSLYKTDTFDCDYTFFYTGIEAEKLSAMYKISPNPVLESFQLQLSEMPTTETYLQLLDELGRPVKGQIIAELTSTIHRDELAKGIYFWQIAQQGKVIGRGKVILQ